jgi:folate-binding protein YgfZ
MKPSDELYHAVTTGSGWADRSHRARIEVRGADRVKFLNNLTTNDVKRLSVGGGCESFVTSLQGKTLAYVSLLAAEDFILLRSERAAWSNLAPHFEKYGLFDDVTWRDVSESTFEWHFAGPSADDALRQLTSDDKRTFVEAPELSHQLGVLADRSARFIHESPTGRAGWSIVAARDDEDAIRQAVLSLGDDLRPRSIDAETFNVLRIEAGTPEFGRDITSDNLPQEIGRDARAINFVKGCYLGQETVARIDALGHVNKIFRGLRIEGDSAPASGSRLEADGKPVGTITSAAYSPGWGQPIALAIIRLTSATAGTRLTVLQNDQQVPAVVCDLPMLPGAG